MALPAGEPTKLEQMAKLPHPSVWDEDGKALLVRRDEFGRLSLARRTVGLGPLPPQAMGVALEPRDVAALRGSRILSAETMQALERNPQGMAVVVHGGTAAHMRRVRLEELMHLAQAAMDEGRAAAAITPDEAAAFLARMPWLRGWAMERYGSDLRATGERARARGLPEQIRSQAMDLHAMMEIGVRLLIGDYADLGLDEATGSAGRQAYLQAVERSWGNAGIERGAEYARTVGLGAYRAWGRSVGEAGYGNTGPNLGRAAAPPPAPNEPGNLGAGRRPDADRGDRDPAASVAAGVGPGLSRRRWSDPNQLSLLGDAAPSPAPEASPAPAAPEPRWRPVRRRPVSFEEWAAGKAIDPKSYASDAQIATALGQRLFPQARSARQRGKENGLLRLVARRRELEAQYQREVPVEDVQDDVYFVSKHGGAILHLYEDGTWTDEAGYLDAERQDDTLEAYLAKQAAFMETAGL